MSESEQTKQPEQEAFENVIEKAIERQETQVEEHIEAFGAEHAETLVMRSELAYSYWHIGRHDDAMAIEEDVLEISERTLGPDDPGTLRARVNLAASYWSAGRHDDAIRIEEEVLEATE